MENNKINNMTKDKIERENFEFWLFGQSKTRRFHLWDTNDCILCNFLKENQGEMNIFCSIDTIQIGANVYNIPLWFRKIFYACGSNPITIGEFQDLYLKQFPETFIKNKKPAEISNLAETVMV